MSYMLLAPIKVPAFPVCSCSGAGADDSQNRLPQSSRVKLQGGAEIRSPRGPCGRVGGVQQRTDMRRKQLLCVSPSWEAETGAGTYRIHRCFYFKPKPRTVTGCLFYFSGGVSFCVYLLPVVTSHQSAACIMVGAAAGGSAALMDFTGLCRVG